MKNLRKSILVFAPALLLASCGGFQGENILTPELVEANMSIAATAQPADKVVARDVVKVKRENILNTREFENSGMMIVTDVVESDAGEKTVFGVYDVIHGAYVVTPCIDDPNNISIVHNSNGIRYTIGNNTESRITNFYVRLTITKTVGEEDVDYFRLVDRFGHVIGDYKADVWGYRCVMRPIEFVYNAGTKDEKVEKYLFVEYAEENDGETLYDYFKYGDDFSTLTRIDALPSLVPTTNEVGDILNVTDLAAYGSEGLRYYYNGDSGNKCVLTFVDAEDKAVHKFVYDNSRTTILSLVGGAMNYQTLELLPRDASDYKFTFKGEKFDYHTYSLDFKKWETKEIGDYPYLAFNASMAPTGNKHIYESLEAREEGVYSYSAIQAYEVDAGKKQLKTNHTLLIDGKLDVRADITAFDFAYKTVTQVGDNFAIGNRIYDGKTLAQIGQVSGTRLTADTDKVYYSYVVKGVSGIMDGTGKVLVKPAYTSFLNNRIQDGKIIGVRNEGDGEVYVLIDVEAGRELKVFDRSFYGDYYFISPGSTTIEKTLGEQPYMYRHLDVNVFGTDLSYEWRPDYYETYGLFYISGDTPYFDVDFKEDLAYIYFDDTVIEGEDEVIYRNYVVIGETLRATVTPYTLAL